MVLGNWNRKKIRDTFEGSSAYAILSVPLSLDKEKDEIIWCPSKNGEYTIKTAGPGTGGCNRKWV